MDTGRKQDILFEDIYYDNDKTGLPRKDEKYVRLWADKGQLELIASVDGVVRVYNRQKDTEYTVMIDPRYDAETVKKEIEAAILCA